MLRPLREPLRVGSAFATGRMTQMATDQQCR